MAGDAGGSLGAGVSRRSVLGGAGKVAAAGVALTATGAVVAPELAAANASGGIAVRRRGRRPSSSWPGSTRPATA